jgi:hypothetical protein
MMDWIAATLSLSTRKHVACWFVFLGSNAMWITYGSLYQQWAMVAVNIVFVIVNFYGLKKWRADAAAPETQGKMHYPSRDDKLRPLRLYPYTERKDRIGF